MNLLFKRTFYPVGQGAFYAFKFPICFASVGADNRYNHPCYKIIEALKAQAAEVIVINEHPETKLLGIGRINKHIELKTTK